MNKNEILLKLKRKWKKDEVVNIYIKAVKEKDIEIGKLKSYISELEEIKKHPKEKRIVNLQLEIKELKSTIEMLQSPSRPTNGW